MEPEQPLDFIQAARDGSATAQWLLLKHLWAVVLRLDADPPAALACVSSALLDHANDARMNPDLGKAVDPAYLELVRLHAIEELERFWDGVKQVVVIRGGHE